MGLKPRATARALHRRAMRYNWDRGLDGLEAILAAPACDYGTGLLIFWMGAPGFDVQYRTRQDVSGFRLKTYDFLRKLEARLLARDFATSDILFNPRYDKSESPEWPHDWTKEYKDEPVRRPIPEALKEPSCPDPAWEAVS